MSKTKISDRTVQMHINTTLPSETARLFTNAARAAPGGKSSVVRDAIEMWLSYYRRRTPKSAQATEAAQAPAQVDDTDF